MVSTFLQNVLVLMHHKLALLQGNRGVIRLPYTLLLVDVYVVTTGILLSISTSFSHPDFAV